MVFGGSLLHFTVKQAFAREWEAHKTRFETLGALAPRLADSSLVIIFDERDRRAPFADHYEMSSYVLALYGNWSLLANTTRHLRFIVDLPGGPGTVLAPGQRGAIAPERLQPVGRIGYDRVVLFRNDHGRLRAIADTVVATEDGTAVELHSNVSRILQGAPTHDTHMAPYHALRSESSPAMIARRSDTAGRSQGALGRARSSELHWSGPPRPTAAAGNFPRTSACPTSPPS